MGYLLLEVIADPDCQNRREAFLSQHHSNRVLKRVLLGITVATLDFFIPAVFAWPPVSPPILQVLQNPPKDLRQIENLIYWGWPEEAFRYLKNYPKEDPQVLFLIGRAGFGMKKYEEALSIWETLSGLEIPKSLQRETYFKWAATLVRLKRYNEAIQIYERSMAASPADRRLLLWQVAKTYLEAGDHANAYQQWVQMGKAFPRYRSSERQWFVGWCLYRMGNPKEAQAIWLQLKNPRAKYWRAKALASLGRQEEAKAIWKELADEKPNHYYGQLASWKSSTTPLFKPLDPMEGTTIRDASWIEDAAKKHKFDPYLILAIIFTESRFQTDAVSPAGAIGLMQLMPQTARKIAKSLGHKNFSWESLWEPHATIRLGLAYLKFLRKIFPEHLVCVLAAYNAGEEAVSRWLSNYQNFDAEIFVEEIPYLETQAYVQNVMARTALYRYFSGQSL